MLNVLTVEFKALKMQLQKFIIQHFQPISCILSANFSQKYSTSFTTFLTLTFIPILTNQHNDNINYIITNYNWGHKWHREGRENRLDFKKILLIAALFFSDGFYSAPLSLQSKNFLKFFENICHF